MAVEVPLLTVPDTVLTEVEEHGRHLAPIMQAVRDFGVSMIFVPQGIKDHHEALPAVLAEPFIALIGDDMYQALGPKAFGKKMLTRLIRKADVAAMDASPRCGKLSRIVECLGVLVGLDVLEAINDPAAYLEVARATGVP